MSARPHTASEHETIAITAVLAFRAGRCSSISVIGDPSPDYEQLTGSIPYPHRSYNEMDGWVTRKTSGTVSSSMNRKLRALYDSQKLITGGLATR